MDPAELARLLDTRDHRLLRAKGWFSDHDDSVYELHIVGRRWSIKAWVGDAPNGIVLIGANPSHLGAAETMFQETSYQQTTLCLSIIGRDTKCLTST